MKRSYAGAKKKNYSKRRRATVKRPVFGAISKISKSNLSRGRAFVDFIYADTITIDPPALGVPGRHTFRLNSLFDPDLTGVGHQPAGFDQYTALFETYCVYAVEYKISILPQGTRQVIFGVTASDVDPGTVDYREYIENGNTQWRHISAGASADNQQLTGYIDIAALNGKTRNQIMSDNTYSSQFNNNPTDQTWLHLWCRDSDGSGDPSGTIVTVELRFKAVLQGTKLVGLS